MTGIAPDRDRPTRRAPGATGEPIHWTELVRQRMPLSSEWSDADCVDLDSFLVDLSSCAKRFSWRISMNGRIRARRIGWPVDPKLVLCPITAVVNAKCGGIILDTARANEHGRKHLGLTGRQAEALMQAADDMDPCYDIPPVFERLKADGEKLRAMVMRAVGLIQDYHWDPRARVTKLP